MSMSRPHLLPDSRAEVLTPVMTVLAGAAFER